MSEQYKLTFLSITGEGHLVIPSDHGPVCDTELSLDPNVSPYKFNVFEAKAYMEKHNFGKYRIEKIKEQS